MLWLVVIFVACLRHVAESQQVPAMFVFGDSLVDVGNTNFLNSIAKANYYPYGCDDSTKFGRFSNAKNFVDLLGDMLGVPYPPAFSDPSTNGAALLRGVNFASAGAGILEETGQHYGDRYSLNQQVLNFESTLDKLRNTIIGSNLGQYLSKSIAIMAIGSNDYINNYLMPSLYNSSTFYNPSDFANLLLNRYARQILALYSVGLRKFLLAGLAPLGCIPKERASGRAAPDRCVDGDNQILGGFNEGLRSLVNQLNTNHPDAHFLYANTYGVVGDMLNNPGSYGFSVIDKGCCGVGDQITCLPLSYPCPNRAQYLFWDAFHPTEAGNSILARRVFSGPISDCYPINVQQLAVL